MNQRSIDTILDVMDVLIENNKEIKSLKAELVTVYEKNKEQSYTIKKLGDALVNAEKDIAELRDNLTC